MTMTKSPVSMCVAKVGLCLPRRIVATWEASRPSVLPSASTMYHWRSISEAFGVDVFITLYSRVACGVIRLLGAIRVVVVGDPPENETLRRGRRLAATAVPAG